MRNKVIFVIIVLLIFLLTIFFKIKSYNSKITQTQSPSKKNEYVNEDEAYYKKLEDKCYDNNCCLASVEKMKSSNAILSKNEKCEPGYDINRLLCVGSYSWCKKQKDDVIKDKKEISFQKKLENYLVTQEDFLKKKNNKDSKLCVFLDLEHSERKIYTKNSFPLFVLASCVEYYKKDKKIVKVKENDNIPVLFELKEDLKTGEKNKIFHKMPRNNSFYKNELNDIFSDKIIEKINQKDVKEKLKQKLDEKMLKLNLKDFNKIFWQISREHDGKIKSKIIRSSYLESEKNVQDSREYQHGINFLKKSNGDYVLIWSSSGGALLPKSDDENIKRQHDIYYSLIDSHNPKINARKLISSPFAQESVSSAINKDGNIFVTMNDFWNTKNEVFQTYGVYKENMKKVKSYQKIVHEGGHSGHVSSTGDKFSVLFSDKWINGGGINDLGTGDDILMNIYDTNGDLINEVNIVAGSETRDWWPLIASSKDNNILLWQRFVDNKDFAKLMFAIYNPDGYFEKKVSVLKENTRFYVYSVEFLEEIDRFLVLGETSDNKGFAILLSTTGDIIAQDYNLTPIIREAHFATKSLNKNEVKVVYPAKKDKIATLSISSNNIVSEGVISVGYEWDISGTDGIFLDNNDLYFVSLSSEGLKELQVRIYEKLNY